jgi:hypothetical protein
VRVTAELLQNELLPSAVDCYERAVPPCSGNKSCRSILLYELTAASSAAPSASLHSWRQVSGCPLRWTATIVLCRCVASACRVMLSFVWTDRCTLCCLICVTAELPPSEPLPSALDCYERAVSLCGLSKSWGLPGLRLGWVACKDQQLLQDVLALKVIT